MVSSINGGEIKVWNIKTGKCHQQFKTAIKYIDHILCNSTSFVYWGKKSVDKYSAIFRGAFNYKEYKPNAVNNSDTIVKPIGSSPVALDSHILAGISEKSILNIWKVGEFDSPPFISVPIPNKTKHYFDEIINVHLTLQYPHVIIYLNIGPAIGNSYSLIYCYNWVIKEWCFIKKCPFVLNFLCAQPNHVLACGIKKIAVLNFGPTNLKLHSDAFSLLQENSAIQKIKRIFTS